MGEKIIMVVRKCWSDRAEFKRNKGGKIAVFGHADGQYDKNSFKTKKKRKNSRMNKKFTYICSGNGLQIVTPIEKKQPY